MGFKILRDFNLAMLAKQAWRFLIYPNSLVSKCYKAKYYPNSEVLQANIGNNPSYGWRSIYSSIWIITKGSCWRIGNGAKVKIWRENWIPSHNNYKVLSPDLGLPNLKYVKDLINSDDSSRNMEKLNQHFLPIDTIQIEQIPLINTNNTDEPMWMFESNGIYTVSSGYQAIQSWKHNSTTSPSTSSKDTTLWKKLWATHTIPRHKMIFWRILNNFLPLRSELSKRGIQC